jgi:hypothetical protein
MKRASLLVYCVAGAFLLSCEAQQVSGRPEAYRKAKAEYDGLANRVVQSVATVGGPLKDLTDEQMASVAALLVMTRVAARSEGIISRVSTSLDGFWVELPEICPPMPKPIEFKLGGCLDEEIAYATAMAKCKDEGKSDDECDKETAAEATAAVLCHMRQLEELGGIIGRIPGRQWPPDPFPWPEGSMRP